jgi:hypothetical protein
MPDRTPSQAGHLPWRPYAVSLIVIVAVTLAPVASLLVAALIANFFGCRLDEGNLHPCVVGGIDLGAMLYGMGVMGWLFLATLPLGAIALLVWLAVLLVHLFVKRRLRGH